MDRLTALTHSDIALPGIDALEDTLDELIALIDEAIGASTSLVTPSPATPTYPDPDNPMFHHAWGLGSPPNSARAAYRTEDYR
jgi:hypothetical protein